MLGRLLRAGKYARASIAGEPALLEDSQVQEPYRSKAIELAVVALAEFHRAGFTHADAMAENVMTDVEAGVARWFDFETVHHPDCSMSWRRADDVRALLATTLLRTRRAAFAGTLQLVLDTYADQEVEQILFRTFTPVPKRPLTFHLGQAGLSLQDYRQIGGLLSGRLARSPGEP